jgi:NitT/TauT family transport system substrate-binding protein
MGKNRVISALSIALLSFLIATAANPARAFAEASEIRIAKQYGLSYLPLIVMEENKLIEQHALKAGLGSIKVSWPMFSGGSATNDALISGAVDFTAAGVAPLIMLWGKSNGEFKGVAAINSTPVYLNTVNPAVKSLKDFTDKDRIALPSVKVSIQAIILQMAAAQVFGQAGYAKLDPLTVAMSHPDAMTALLSGRSEITAHLGSPPFMFKELEDKRVHRVFDSYDILGGSHTFIVLSSSKTFRQRNPKVFAAVLDALEEATAFVKKNRRASAELYLKSTKSKEPVDEVLSELNQPSNIYATAPVSVTKFADFMYRTGSIKTRPGSWKDLFFDNIYAKEGS